MQTNLQQLDETHAAFELPQAETINHICVFLLGTGASLASTEFGKSLTEQLAVPFPEGYGASVHFFWPGKGFQLLGMYVEDFLHFCRCGRLMNVVLSDRLSNEKPSAIFRLRGNFSSQSSGSHAVFSGASTPIADVSPQGVTALLGLAIEPLDDIMRQVSSLPSAVAPRRDPAADTTLLAERIVKHLFNYISGFAGGNALTPEVTIPIGTIVRWYESFMSKVRNSGIGFLENQES